MGRYHLGDTQTHPGSRRPSPMSRASVKRRSPYAGRGVSPGQAFVVLANSMKQALVHRNRRNLQPHHTRAESLSRDSYNEVLGRTDDAEEWLCGDASDIRSILHFTTVEPIYRAWESKKSFEKDDSQSRRLVGFCACSMHALRQIIL